MQEPQVAGRGAAGRTPERGSEVRHRYPALAAASDKKVYFGLRLVGPGSTALGRPSASCGQCGQYAIDFDASRAMWSRFR